MRPVEAAGQAAHLLVTRGGRRRRELTQLLVPASAAGVSVTPMQTVDLTKRFGAVTFDDVGSGPTPWWASRARPPPPWSASSRRLVILNAEAVGAMQAGFDMTVEWGFDRYTFGRPLASYQAIKHRFADMLTWLEASHAISDAACAAAADGEAQRVRAAAARPRPTSASTAPSSCRTACRSTAASA